MFSLWQHTMPRLGLGGASVGILKGSQKQSFPCTCPGAAALPCGEELMSLATCEPQKGLRLFPAGSSWPPGAFVFGEGLGEGSRMLKVTATPRGWAGSRQRWGPPPPLPGRPAGAQLGSLFTWGGRGRPVQASSKCNCIWTLKRNCVKWAAALKSTALFGMEICFFQN